MAESYISILFDIICNVASANDNGILKVATFIQEAIDNKCIDIICVGVVNVITYYQKT